MGHDDHTHSPGDTPFNTLIRLLLQETSVDFSQYKQSTLHRRLRQRMHVLNIGSEAAYLLYLEAHEQEKNLLFGQLLIHVTEFFRDEAAFKHFCAEVVPSLLASKAAGAPLRIWVCGCASGEEAYSIAICLHEHIGEGHHLSKCRIFASDLSPQIISRARRAVYGPAELTGVSEQRLARYFTPCPGGYQVINPIRDVCVFMRHNVLSDPPFTRLDLISCRNMLIYVQPALQKKVLATFSCSLKPNGILFLGKSETCSGTRYFEALNKSFNIYANKQRFQNFLPASAQSVQTNLYMSIPEKPYAPEKQDFQKAADELLLSRYVPAGVVVNEALEIVDFRGNTGFYIDPSPGIASLNVLKMIRRGLYSDLQDALQKVRMGNTSFKKDGIALEHDGGLLHINLEVHPLQVPGQKYLLILFHQVQAAATYGNGSPGGNQDALRMPVHKLEQELLKSHEQLRALTEQQEATSEEFLSANEELKNLNEELQTSQEELISLNDELNDRNAELNQLNDDLVAAREFADSVNDTVNEAVLVLDKSLRLRSANRSFYATFQVTKEEMEGKLIYELGNQQWHIPLLRRLLEEILPQQTEIRNFEVTYHFPLTGDHTMCLNARQIVAAGNNKEPLIYLAIEDITEKRAIELELKKKQEALLAQEERQRLAIAATSLSTWDYDPATQRLVLSESGLALLGADGQRDLLLSDLLWAIHPDDKDGASLAFDELLHGRKNMLELECRLKATPGRQMPYVLIMGKSLAPDGETTRISGIISDITERKTAELLLAQAFTSLEFALHTGSIGSWELDPEHFILTTSDECKLNFGLPPGAPFTYEDWINRIVEADREEVKHALEHALGNQGLFKQEYRITWPDETVHWIGSTGKVLYTDGGQPGKMVGVTADITGRKSAEQKLQYSEQHFRTLSDSAPVMIAMSNADGQFEFRNDEWLSFTGRSKDSGNGSWEDDIHPDDVPSLMKLREEVSVKYSRITTEFRMRNKGRYRWASCVAMPRFGPGNKFVGYTVACTDTHDQHLLAEELERKVQERTTALKDMNDELQERNQELEQFAFVTSHDLQEPLRKIRMYISMLIAKDDQQNEFLSNYLHKIESCAMRMIGLIRDLLSYSGLKDKTREFVPTDLNKAVQSALLDFDLLIQEKKAVITTGSLPVIRAVPLQINQLFHNMIGNALKFVPAGRAPEVEITSTSLTLQEVSAQLLNPNLSYVRIGIRDNGIGFNEQYAEMIFGLFQRLNNRESYAGNGIGLALCKRIVQNHHGKIIPHSKEQEGTTFEIILPANQ